MIEARLQHTQRGKGGGYRGHEGTKNGGTWKQEEKERDLRRMKDSI